ncbi:hypothetical protein M2147_002245, partial [Ohessyouella blattaphilus]
QTYEFVKVQNRSYFRRFTAVRDCWNLIFHLSGKGEGCPHANSRRNEP